MFATFMNQLNKPIRKIARGIHAYEGSIPFARSKCLFLSDLSRARIRVFKRVRTVFQNKFKIVPDCNLLFLWAVSGFDRYPTFLF
jgi:hypothetical protein